MNDNDETTYHERLGSNIRTARLLQRKTLEEVADVLGVSYQQLQKYEAGINRLSVVRLDEIANALGVDPARLIPRNGSPEEANTTPRVLQLVAGVQNLPSDRIRGDLVQLIHGIALAWAQRPRTD